MKFYIFIALLIFSSSIWPQEINILKLPSDRINLSSQTTGNSSIPYSFQTEPRELFTTYWDYWPFQQNSYSIASNIEHSYFVYQQESAHGAERYINYSYLDSNGNISTDRVTGNSYREGYPSVAIDRETVDPFVAYHFYDEINDKHHTALTFDLNHYIGGAGYWAQPQIFINNNSNPAALYETDEFICPEVFTSKSPFSANHSRIYIFSKNYGNQTGNDYDMNICYAYADYTIADLDESNQLNWTISTIPQMNSYVYDLDFKPKYNIGVSVNGEICISGYFLNDDCYSLSIPESFILFNGNFGQSGSWQEHRYNSERFVDPPLDLDGTNSLINNPFFAEIHSQNRNGIFTSDGKYHWIANFGLLGNDLETDEIVQLKHCLYLKKMSYDPISNQIQIIDLSPKGENPNDNNLYLPWDENEDGVVDHFNENGEATLKLHWPVFYHSYDQRNSVFSHNKLTQNENTDYMIALWNDGLKNVYFTEYELSQFAEYETISEFCLSISDDYGTTWSDTIALDIFNDPELNNISPILVNPSNILQVTEHNNLRLELMFYDDYSYGFPLTQTLPLPYEGKISYLTLNLEPFTGNNDTPIFTPTIIIKNYPNPFCVKQDSRFSQITIECNLLTNQNGSLIIYNCKGQEIKEIHKGNFKKGLNTFYWDGRNQNNELSQSGIYFSRFLSSKSNISSKILLLK